jgi:hypothetical protein
MRCYTIPSKQDPNNISDSKPIDRCCYDHESIFVVTYSSERTWLVCNFCEQDEAFKLGRTGRTRISS